MDFLEDLETGAGGDEMPPFNWVALQTRPLQEAGSPNKLADLPADVFALIFNSVSMAVITRQVLTMVYFVPNTNPFLE